MVIKFIPIILFYCILQGCNLSNKEDPFKPYNKVVFKFNKSIDKNIIKPISQTYQITTSSKFKIKIKNIISNIGEPMNMANHVLQGDIIQAVTDFWRLAINTTLGIGGIFDVAGHMGLKYDKQTFGGTLRKWGIKSNVYIILPFLGPSTFLDILDIPFSLYTNPISYVDSNAVKYAYYGFNTSAARIKLKSLYNIINNSMDPYAMQKKLFLQYVNKPYNTIDDSKEIKDEDNGVLLEELE